MRPFDLDQLRSFVCIVETGSLSAAGPRLFRSQSALSEQIRKLEEFAGIPLVERSKKGVRPTAAGERLLAYARQMLSISEQALDDMRGSGLAGELRLAITDYFQPGMIAVILKRLRMHYPRLRLHVSVRKSLQISDQLQGEAFDIGITMRILDGRNLDDGISIRREPLNWVVASDFVAETDVPLPMLLLPDSCQLAQFVQKTLEKHDMPFVIAHSASGVAGLQSALVAGLGVTCLNASAVPDGAGIWTGGDRLPALPEVEFSFLPPRDGESQLIGEVRAMLREQFV